MSEAEIDSIIKKYNHSLPKPKLQLLYTERKKQSHDPHTITFMDNNYTPTRTGGVGVGVGGREEELLRQLDQSERRLAVSERNYAEVGRKYEKLRLAYESLSGELERERKGRLQELIDTQNKLNLLQSDNETTLLTLQQKDSTIAILSQKLSQKQQQVDIFESQLEQISRRLCETLELKSRESQSYLTKGMELQNEEANRSLENIRGKYEKIIQGLKAEVGRFEKELGEKEKEKRRVLGEMEEMSRKNIGELREIKEVMGRNQEQYKGWLDQSKKQKLEIIEKYQQQIRQIRKAEFLQKLSTSDLQIDSTTQTKTVLKSLQSKNLQLQTQLKKAHLEIQRLNGSQKELEIKYKGLEEEFRHLRSEYLGQIQEGKRVLAGLKGEEERAEGLRVRLNKREVEVQQGKIRSEELEAQNKALKKELDNLKADMGKQLKSLIHVKKQLSEATNNELNMNSQLTQTTTKLHTHIRTLESQLQTLQTDLLTTRLQNSHLQSLLQQTKTSLHREYTLSLQNTKHELQQQIKQTMQAKTEQELEKQGLYLRIFQLERRYELLRSQVVTGEEMLRMGAKMGKYYGRKVK